ncbi:MAG TPA: DUF1508 domain-containing protein, partial [Alicycliphilus sp.]|nr:DUF1508 domain-containing protein [Alicycliphilus sp.]
TPEEAAALRRAYEGGIAWGEAKQLLFERIDREIAPMRARYDDFMTHPEKVEAALQIGARRARTLAQPFVQRLRAAVGLRSLSATQAQAQGAHKAGKAQLPAFKQYREADGRFYFKLVAADGRPLLQSTAFDAPRDAGQAIARLQKEAGALQALAAQLAPLAGVDAAEVTAALQALAAAAES